MMKKTNIILTPGPSLSNRKGGSSAQKLFPSLTIERGQGVSGIKRNVRLFVVLLFTLITGCEKDVNLNLPQPTPQICVDGYVQPGYPAYLFLSHNFAFFGTTSANTVLTTDIIHGAHIAVNDGFTTDSMIEVIPSLGLYATPHMTGVTGRTYNLTVKAQGQTLTASTSILPAISLDSAWFKVQPGLDSLGYLWAILHDPPAPGNCYRWLVERVGIDTTFIPPYESAFDDSFINGQSFEFFYGRGSLPGSKAKDDTDAEAGYFKKGETCVIEFCTISNTSYQFFNEYYYQLNNVGNPFGSPAPVTGNITGGLGIWCGYGTSYDTVHCK
jgi:hypothetical protein